MKTLLPNQRIVTSKSPESTYVFFVLLILSLLSVSFSFPTNHTNVKNDNLKSYPDDISGVWENSTMVPAFEPEGHVQRESIYKLVLEQNENQVFGTFSTKIFMGAGTVRKHIRVKGSYNEGRLYLETVGLIKENCYAPENVSALYDLTFRGEVRDEGNRVILDAEYDFASYRTFQMVGGKMMLANGMSGLKGPIDINVIRTSLEITPREKFEITGKEEVIRPADSVFSNILFKQSTTELLTAKDSAEVKRLGKMLETHPDWKVVLEGYTENRGLWRDNIKLSRNRSDLVKQYLIDWNSISPERIITEGYGPHKPIGKNQNEFYRKLNRRVEVKVKVD